MENIIIGAVIAGIAQLAKKLNVDQKYVVTFVSLIAWSVWYFITPDVQNQIVESRTQIAGSATVVYNVLKIAFTKVK